MSETKGYQKLEKRRWHPDYQPSKELERMEGRVLELFKLSEVENQVIDAEIAEAKGEINLIIHPGSIAPNHRDNPIRRQYLSGINGVIMSKTSSPTLLFIPEMYYAQQIDRLLRSELNHNIYVAPTLNEDPVLINYAPVGASKEKNPFIKNSILAQSTKQLAEYLLVRGVNRIRLSGSNLLVLPLPQQHQQDYLNLLEEIRQMGEGGELVAGAERHFLEVTGQKESPRFCLEACVGHMATHLMPYFEIEITNDCYPHNGQTFQQALRGGEIPNINAREFVDVSGLL